MDDDKGLGPASIHWLASIVADGTATPEEARELLVEFVRQADTGNVHPLLIAHLHACIKAFLGGRKVLDPATSHGRKKPEGVLIPTLDKAFGIVRPIVGGPRTDPDTLAEVAMEVLERRLVGESLQEAAATVAEDRKARRVRVTAETEIRNVWARHQADGYLLARIARVEGVEASGPWTPAEVEKLCRIFKGKAWFCPPHVDAKARMDAILAEVDRPGADPATVSERVQAVIAKIDGTGTPEISRKKPA